MSSRDDVPYGEDCAHCHKPMVKGHGMLAKPLSRDWMHWECMAEERTIHYSDCECAECLEWDEYNKWWHAHKASYSTIKPESIH